MYWDTIAPVLATWLKHCRFTAMHVDAHGQRLRQSCFTRDPTTRWSRAMQALMKVLRQKKVDPEPLLCWEKVLMPFLSTPPQDTPANALPCDEETDTRSTRQRVYATPSPALQGDASTEGAKSQIKEGTPTPATDSAATIQALQAQLDALRNAAKQVLLPFRADVSCDTYECLCMKCP
jgi:hypothetical protein